MLEGEPERVLVAETLQSVYRWPLAVATDPATGATRVTPLDSRVSRDG